MHSLYKNSGVIDGKRNNWQQCARCGATKHGGKWWIAGKKSKITPPCNKSASIFESEWYSNAEYVDYQKDT